MTSTELCHLKFCCSLHVQHSCTVQWVRTVTVSPVKMCQQPAILTPTIKYLLLTLYFLLKFIDNKINLKSLPFYTLSKKQRTKWNNFLQWIDTSTNIFTIKCTGYHHLKQKLSKFSEFHAPQLPKKAGAFGLCHLQLNPSYPLLKNIFYILELLWKLAEFRYCKPNTAISL